MATRENPKYADHFQEEGQKDDTTVLIAQIHNNGEGTMGKGRQKNQEAMLHYHMGFETEKESDPIDVLKELKKNSTSEYNEMEDL
jgi:hypothetical protein